MLSQKAKELLGMQKLTNKQIVYISIPKKDYVEYKAEEIIMEEEKSFFENILEKIKNFKCTHETGNIYKFIGYKPEIQYLNRKLQLKLDKKYDARENIKKILKY